MARSMPLRTSDPKDVPGDRFAAVFERAIRAIEAAGIDYVVIGGIGSAAYGRPRWTTDVDLLVSPPDAGPALEALAAAGFQTERTNEHWIFKAVLDGVLIDILFKASGDVYLDRDMLDHAQVREFLGVRARMAAPEDLIVVKSIAHDEPSARHWNDALSIIASCELDWDYLLAQSMRSPRRVLSLLVYAQSTDILVPDGVIRALVDRIYGGDADGR